MSETDSNKPEDAKPEESGSDASKADETSSESSKPEDGDEAKADDGDEAKSDGDEAESVEEPAPEPIEETAPAHPAPAEPAPEPIEETAPVHPAPAEPAPETIEDEGPQPVAPAGTPDVPPLPISDLGKVEPGASVAAKAGAEPAEHLGLLVEFETAGQLMSAAEKVRDAGFSDWDCHTPYPVHGLDKAMGIKPTILPWLAFGGGLTGCLVGFLLQTYTNGPELPFSLYQSGNVLISEIIAPFVPSGYPFITSGKPIISTPANIPVMFELTILLSAFGAFFGMLGLNRLPRFHHPVFTSENFRRATSDRFFISIEATDPVYHRERAKAFCESLGGASVEELEG